MADFPKFMEFSDDSCHTLNTQFESREPTGGRFDALFDEYWFGDWQEIDDEVGEDDLQNGMTVEVSFSF